MRKAEFSWQNSTGLTIKGQEWKPEGDARGVLALVHGLGEHIGRYQHVAEKLTSAGFALIGIDLPGHGQSGGVRGHASYDGIADDIAHLLEEAGKRYPGKPRFLYGHSMGGALVLFFSLKCRPMIQGVICTSPGLATGQPVPQAKLFIAKVMSRLMPSFTLDNGLDRSNLSHVKEVIEAYGTDPLVHPRISARLGWDLITLGPWIVEHAGAFPLPLLLVQGSEDHIVSPKGTNAFAQAAPKNLLTYKVWEGLYHETHNEAQQEMVLQFMVDWLERQTA